ncbi:Cys-tRNA(Pro) deacylase [Corynebacterium poyangense]|uniref:Cys-tRNA(Pro)/Cys-tRNA(Cys) deacylase n=1 Tax=Corynebacterium poyangense TaxID=2684405 RepID=A0A7H0SML0_9CORY|nr:Cys-tRNA(Pro) deacylase [Corynebacterium poyangense]MBZ8176891.1 Cys-tRNA(Pro) deacylase [Corynebacterium poyangense]QNQ89785.1 Cys-tRNA(Pro) deacylase [Corynebacterium poyangense]
MAKKKNRAAATPAIQILIDQKIAHHLDTFDGGTEHFGEQAAKALGGDPAVILKTLMVDLDPRRAGKHLGVCCIPVTAKLSLKKAARSFGVPKADMASPAAAQRSSGYVPGGISPLGQKNPVETRIDSSVAKAEKIWVSGGKRGLDIAVNPQDLAHVLGAQFSDLQAE